ncbi:phosphotransferase [Salipaludibacillus keqinensis]|uniref:Phosphotransferase n=1 Tax=Salipaludibacillus keqinensis TaxID=2045207 RepID=A0A323TG37_9BACI|nr:phosphotransferase family protein [Salipaludibacillus keqinensis]PYZ93801.1 phosphotransferase [Salipaludibacillus keqinensis]
MRVKRLEHFMGEGWQLRPAGGATGEAYVAEQGEQKIFIKRNSSPFLAVLSAEGIVPKLLWTKRLENGDVITAQRWVDGRELKSYEMHDNRVAALLSKIHQSKDLLDMFKRMGNRPLTPEAIRLNIIKKTEHLHIQDPYVNEALTWLSNHTPYYSEDNYVVCHADVNHNNWIHNDINNLFLIDWDGAQVADPALDLAPLLYEYIPRDDWSSWLQTYGVSMDANLMKRMQWYMVAQCVENILWYWQRHEYHDITKWSDLLSEILHEAGHHKKDK